MRARRWPLVFVACLSPAACAASLASLARDGRYVEACRRLPDADTDERRELQRELIRRANVRVRYRRVPDAELEQLVGHPLDPRYASEMVTVDLDVQMSDSALRMSISDQKLDIWKARRVEVLSYLAHLGVPPMPHEERVLAQGSEHRDDSGQALAILGHIAIGGALIVPWAALGGDPGDLVPGPTITREPDLTEEERRDIAEWSRRDDVLAALGQKPRRFFMAGTHDVAVVRPGKSTTLRAAFWNAESPAGRSGLLEVRSLPGYFPDAFALVNLSLSVPDPSYERGECDLRDGLVRIDLSATEDELARRVRSRPRRLTDVVDSLERRGWMTLSELEGDIL